MSNLTIGEKRKLEKLFGMGSGYVLNFSNRTFEDFVYDSVGINIYDDTKYNYSSGSKANRLRAFWNLESNYLVGKLLEDILLAWDDLTNHSLSSEQREEFMKIVSRLKNSAPVPDISILSPNTDEKTFRTLAKSVRESIERNEPEIGLDHLHTFLIKYFRELCKRHGISIDRNKPLHSLFGEYLKVIKNKGLIKSEMTELILRSTISIMDAFNKVRNDQSFAHDNVILNYDESLLIFKYVTNLLNFIMATESKNGPNVDNEEDKFTDLPF